MYWWRLNPYLPYTHAHTHIYMYLHTHIIYIYRYITTYQYTMHTYMNIDTLKKQQNMHITIHHYTHTYHLYTYEYVYVYIYIEREREKFILIYSLHRSTLGWSGPPRSGTSSVTSRTSRCCCPDWYRPPLRRRPRGGSPRTSTAGWVATCTVGRHAMGTYVPSGKQT